MREEEGDSIGGTAVDSSKRKSKGRGERGGKCKKES
jgi:hypothetical protein